MKRLLFVAIGLFLLAGVVTGTRAALAQLNPPGADIPTTTVKRGRVDTSVNATGELKATKSEVLSAPASGAQLRILTLKQTGVHVKKGDVIVEFDPSDQEYQVEEQKSVLREANLEIVKLQAEQAAQKAQDDVDLLTARFDVRKGELDVQGNELLSSIEARKRELTLEEARRRLAQLEEDVKSRAKSSEAALAVAAEKRNKAQLTIDQALRLLDQMHLRATMDGIVAVRENRETNFFFWGMTFNEYREGDTVSSGSMVAEVLDLSQIEFSAKVSETERGRLSEGQQAMVAIDALGGTPIKARTSLIGGISQTGRFFGQGQGPTRQFDVSFKLEEIPPALRPGLSAQVTIEGDPLENVLYVPRQALFDKSGKPTVFLKAGAGFEPKEVKVVTRTQNSVVLDQVAEGAEIALADPTRRAGGEVASQAGPPTRMVGTR
jgi:biotin carboxyl carrier protein